MGMFGGGGDNEGSRLADQQLKENRAELEAKRKSLYEEKLDMIKGQGGASWAPDNMAGSQKQDNQMGGFGL